MRTIVKPKHHRPDDENPEWTAEDITQARPAAEALRELVGREAAEQILRRGRGRPRKPLRKVNQTLRIDPDVLDSYRRLGKGWQTRINQVLRDNMPDRQK